MNSNLISIIVPVYKVENYLDRCINSIVNQTYRNIEIILIDDGSPDNCPKICDEWEKKDDRIRVVHKVNEGVSAARNYGIEISHGEFIGFVDSDDYIEKDMYSSMIKKIKETDTDMCYCDYKYRRSETEIVYSYNHKEIINKNEYLFLFCERNGMNFSVWNKLFRKNKLQDIKFRDNISIKEDAVFIAEYVNSIEKVSYLNKPFYNYCFFQNSALNQNNITKKVTTLDAMQIIIEVLKENKIKTYLEEQCKYICNCEKYKYICKREKINIDFSGYELKANEYYKELISNRKMVGFRDIIKVILARKFTKLYIGSIQKNLDK